MHKILLPTLALALAVATLPTPSHALTIAAGSRIKSSGSAAVYYLGPDNKRYAFPNQGTYFSWFADFSGVVTLTDAELASFPLGGAVTYRPGVRLLKISSDPKTYAVAPGGTLRWVTSESLAASLYGSNWNTKVDDVSDAFFATYRTGANITQAGDFSPAGATSASSSISVDKGLGASASVDALRAFALNDLNARRIQMGKPALTLNAELSAIADVHSRDMAASGTLSHAGSLGESSGDRIMSGKVPDLVSRTFTTLPHPSGVSASGENIGQILLSGTVTTPETGVNRLHTAFISEPAGQANHRGNMLSETAPFTEIGIGVFVDGNNMLWLTEDFVAK
jgi:uncharacterized protein YkwD